MTYTVAATKANEDIKEVEEVRKYGNSEREVIEGGSSQTWTIVRGNLARYVNIVMMHHEDVPTDTNSLGVRQKIERINEYLKKSTIDHSSSFPSWKVLKAETVPQISPMEMR